MADKLSLRSKSGKFAVEQIKAYLRKMPFTVQAHNDADTHILCGDRGGKNFYEAWCKNPQPGIAHPYAVAVAKIKDDVIDLTIMCSGKALDQCREFVKWLISQHELIIKDSDGNDWTEKCAEGSTDIIFKE